MDSVTFNNVAGSFGGLLAVLYVYLSLTREKLDHIPTIGHSHWLLSYLDVYRRGSDVSAEVKEGYAKYPNMPFKVALMQRWEVIVSGETALADIKDAPALSFEDAVHDNIQTKHTIGKWILDSPVHIPVVRSPLTRNLAVRFGDLHDEIKQSFGDNLPCKGNEWTTVHAQTLVMQVVARTSNRYFVGLPLCRNSDWAGLNITFTMTLMSLVNKIRSFPSIFSSLVAWRHGTLEKEYVRALGHLGPVIERRLEQDAAYGDDWDKPNDLITWLLDEAKGDLERSPERITRRVLNLNFAAIHTTTLAFLNVMYTVAADPSLAEILRQEVQTVTDEHGWTKNGMAELKKMDSLYKESQRFHGIGATGIGRVATTPLTLSSGIFLPKGTMISVAMNEMMHDETNIPKADTFDPFRYSRLREAPGESIKHQMVAPDKAYLTFGYGKHACPGRFFAANEVKAMLAHILVTYDVKTVPEGVRPPNVVYGMTSIPNPRATLSFRLRSAQ